MARGVSKVLIAVVTATTGRISVLRWSFPRVQQYLAAALGVASRPATPKADRRGPGLR